MLVNCIKAENKKIKSPVIWLIFFIIPILPAIMGTFNYLTNIEILKSEWYSLWTQHTLFYTSFFFAPLIAIYSSYIWRLEHLNRNWNFIMTVPVKVENIFMAKFLIIFKMSILTQIWICILFLICGKIVGLPGMFPMEIITWLVRGSVGGIVIISLQLLLSMVIRSFSIPIIIALGGSIGGLVLSSSGKRLIWPYALMMMGMNSNKSTDVIGGEYVLFFVSVAVFVSIFTLITMRILKNKDVRTN